MTHNQAERSVHGDARAHPRHVERVLSIEHLERAARAPAVPEVGSEPDDAVDLSVLFAAYGASCHGLAFSILRDKDMAQDVVQDAFLEHWRGKAFDAELSTHKRWLLMLTHRKAVDRVRYEQRRRCLPLEAAPEGISTARSPEDAALASVLTPKVRKALAVLPQAQQQALALAFWGGYTQREIAVITGAPLGTIKTRTRSGMIALRRHLEDERMCAQVAAVGQPAPRHLGAGMPAATSPTARSAGRTRD